MRPTDHPHHIELIGGPHDGAHGTLDPTTDNVTIDEVYANAEATHRPNTGDGYYTRDALDPHRMLYVPPDQHDPESTRL